MRTGLQTQILKPRGDSYKLIRQVNAQKHVNVDQDTFVVDGNKTECFTQEGDFKFSLPRVDAEDKLLLPKGADSFVVDKRWDTTLTSYCRETGQKRAEEFAYYSALGKDGKIRAHKVTPNREQDLAITLTPDLKQMSQFEFGYHVQRPHYLSDSNIWVGSGKTENYKPRTTVHDGNGQILFKAYRELELENTFEKDNRALVILSSPRKRMLLDIQDGNLQKELPLPKDANAVLPVEGGYIALGDGRVSHLDSEGEIQETTKFPYARQIHFDGQTVYAGSRSLVAYTPGAGIKTIHKGLVDNLALLDDGSFLVQSQGEFLTLDSAGKKLSQSDNAYQIDPSRFLDTKVSQYTPRSNDKDGWEDFAAGVAEGYHFMAMPPGEQVGSRPYPTSAHKINFVKDVQLDEGLEAMGVSKATLDRLQNTDPSRHMSNSPLLVPKEEVEYFKKYGPSKRGPVTVDRENNRIFNRGREGRAVLGDYGAVVDFNTIPEPNRSFPSDDSGLAAGVGDWIETSGLYPVHFGEESVLIEQNGNSILALGSDGGLVARELPVRTSK